MPTTTNVSSHRTPRGLTRKPRAVIEQDLPFRALDFHRCSHLRRIRLFARAIAKRDEGERIPSPRAKLSVADTMQNLHRRPRQQAEYVGCGPAFRNQYAAFPESGSWRCRIACHNSPSVVSQQLQQTVRFLKTGKIQP